MARPGRPPPAPPRAPPPRSPGRPPAPSRGAPRTVEVNGYSERWLRQGFPWVYPAEVVGAAPVAGSRVDLVSGQGAALGSGIADDGWISVRRFRPEGGPIDAAFLAQALAQAAARRRGLIGADTTAWRWVNAENDDLPGVRVDVYGAHLVLTLDSASLAPLVPDLLAGLLPGPVGVDGAVPARSVHLAWRPDPRDTTARPLVGAGTCIFGEAPEEVEVLERGLRVLVRPGAGKDVGVFTDMRDNRAWLEPHWKGRRFLNLFAHTGVFSLSAAHHGAAQTTSVDLSGPALARAARNLSLNGIDPGAHPMIEADVFKALDRLRRQGHRFDVVLADPPGFSHGEEGRWSGETEYPRLVAACLAVLEPGGWLLCASNLGSVSPKQFQGQIAEGARKAGRAVRLLHEGGAASDHAAALAFPEGRYLKFWVLGA